MTRLTIRSSGTERVEEYNGEKEGREETDTETQCATRKYRAEYF